jgi:hypothetical protein
MNLSNKQKDIIHALKSFEPNYTHPRIYEKDMPDHLCVDGEFPIELCSDEFLKECLRINNNSFSLFPYELQTVELANFCIDIELSLHCTSISILNMLEYLRDGSVLTYENKLKLMIADTSRYGDHNKYLDIKMIDELCERANIYKFSSFKKSFIDNLTEKHLRKLIDRNPYESLRIKSKNFNSELCAYAITKMGDSESIDEFYKVYNRMKKYLNEDIVKAVYEKGFYCSDLLKDAIKFKISINPIDAYSRSLKTSKASIKTCLKIIGESYTTVELNQFYLDYQDKLSKNQKNEVITSLKLDVELVREVFTCPCCDKKLSQEFIDRIKNS